MPGELDGLKFVVEVDTQGSEGKLNTLAKALERIAKVTGLDKVGQQVQTFVSNISQIDTTVTVSKFEKLAAALSKIKISKANSDNIQNFVGALYALDDETIARWERIAGAFNSEGFSNLSTALQGMGSLEVSGDNVTNIRDFVIELKNLDTATINNWQQIATILQSIPQVNIPKVPNVTGGGATAQAGAQANAGAQSAGVASAQIQQATPSMNQATTASSALSRALNLASGSARKLGTGLLAVGKAALQTATYLPRMVGERFFTQVRQATAGMGQFLGSLKRVAMYRLIRSAIAALTQGFQEGIKNLYAYSNAMGTVFAQSMDRLASSSLYLKNSLAAMAAPIINAIVPAVETAIDAIVRLINWVNMLISALTGKAVTTVAKKVGTAFDGAAGSAGGASKAAKELKKTILGFDELNVLNDQNNGSGGGGGGAGGGGAFSDMFEEVEVPTEISDFAKRLREAFESQDWMELGKILGDKFNEIVDSIKWGDLGDKVGGGFRAIINTSLSFLRTADFQAVGAGLAEFFNHAIGSVDWDNLGAFLVRRVTSLLDIAIGFINNFDFGQAAAAISDFVSGFWNEVADWFEEVDWEQLGESIGYGLADAIASIKWAEVISALGRAISGLATGLWSAVKGLVKGLYEKAVEWLDDKIGKEKLTPFSFNVKDNSKDLWVTFKQWMLNRIFFNPISFSFGVANNSTNLWGSFKILLNAAMTGSPFLILARMYDNANGNWLSYLNSLLKAMMTSPFAVVPQIVNNAQDLWSKIKSWWNGASSNGLSTKVNVTSNIDSAIKNMKSSVNGMSLGATLTLKVPKFKVEWATSSHNGNSVQYPKITPQYAAKGAILDSATLFGSFGNPLIAGEAGREAILPLDRNTQWMDDIASRLSERTKGDQDSYTSTYMALVDWYQAYMSDSVAAMRADMRRQADKDESVSISASSVTAVLAQKNLRDGKTTVPVG